MFDERKGASYGNNHNGTSAQNTYGLGEATAGAAEAVGPDTSGSGSAHGRCNKNVDRLGKFRRTAGQTRNRIAQAQIPARHNEHRIDRYDTRKPSWLVDI